MALTTLSDRRTPSRPVEITFAPQTGLPSDLQTLILIGHRGAPAASGSTGIANYTVVDISNVADVAAASGEVATKVGDGSELAKMILAAVRANAAGGTHPAIKAIPLALADTDFGASDAALTAALAVHGDYLVSCYEGTSATLLAKLHTAAQTMSGPERTQNNQFGTFGVSHIRSVTDTASLPSPDTQYGVVTWLPDTGTAANAPAYSVAECAAAAAAMMASNGIPFNPLDSITIPGLLAPLLKTDWITVGAGLTSEAALVKGITPLRVKTNGEVAFVRTVTTRITYNGATVSAYYDVQDFNVLYYWRKTLFTRASQSDFVNVKASQQKAQDLKSEMIRLAKVFETQGMFQAVDQLAKTFSVARRSTDRSTFEAVTPVNVIPGLHNILVQVQAGTLFDSFVI